MLGGWGEVQLVGTSDEEAERVAGRRCRAWSPTEIEPTTDVCVLDSESNLRSFSLRTDALTSESSRPGLWHIIGASFKISLSSLCQLGIFVVRKSFVC